MEWIRFEDMEPPIGLNIVVTSNNRLAIIKWERKYLTNNCETIHFMSNDGVTPNEVCELDFWAPVDFLNNEVPATDEYYGGTRLPDGYDWRYRNKDKHNFNLLKELIYKINNTKEEELQDTCIYLNGIKIKEYNGHTVHSIYLKRINELFGKIGVRKDK
jgi:hypothetical protein